MSRLEAINKNISFNRQSDVESADIDSIPIAPLEVNLPEIVPAFSHLKELFFISGQVMQSGHGLLPLTWQELKAFIEVNELELTIWERQVIKKMSDAYCAEYSRSSDPNRPAPYRPQVEETEVDQVAKAMRIKQGLSAFKKRKG